MTNKAPADALSLRRASTVTNGEKRDTRESMIKMVDEYMRKLEEKEEEAIHRNAEHKHEVAGLKEDLDSVLVSWRGLMERHAAVGDQRDARDTPSPAAFQEGVVVWKTVTRPRKRNVRSWRSVEFPGLSEVPVPSVMPVAHESQLLPLKRRSLDVHLGKVEEGHRLKRQQIKSWTGCSRSNEQLGPRHYLQKMILLSGAWLCTLRLREMNLKEEEEREVWHLNLDIMEGITMHQLASWPGLEVLNYLKDRVRDYLIHQEADSLVGKVLWLELHINLELHMVIHKWARLQVVVMHRRMPPLPVVELMVVELQHILDYHMVIPQVQVDLPGQDQILPQAFMVLWIFLPSHYLHPKDVRKAARLRGVAPEGSKEGPTKEKEVEVGSPGSTSTSSPSPLSPTTVSGGGLKDSGGGSPAKSTLDEKPKNDIATDLIQEAATLLKTLRSVKTMRLKQISAHPQEFGTQGFALLDGGATHALRFARPEERAEIFPVEVELAQGSTVLYRHPKHRTLLSLTEVEPIIPLGLLVERGFKVEWRRSGCSTHHPTPIACWLRNGCPIMHRQPALDMLAQFEMEDQGEVALSDEDRSWWQKHFPELPLPVLQHMAGQSQEPTAPPWNRRLLALVDYVAEEKSVGASLIWTMMSSAWPTATLKHLGLWLRAQECRRAPTDVGMLLESPRDPAEYLSDEEGARSGEGCDDSPLPTKLADRIRTSKSWAAWAPGLVAAIKESLRRLLGILEEESRNGDTHNMSKMDLAAWHRHIKQGHIPFRADCRICGEAMGCDKPHKRLGGSATKFTMSADLCGPFPAGRDLGAGVTCKYALISTVAVPIVSELPGEVAEPYDTADDVKYTEDLPCDREEREMLPDDEVQRLNELAQIEEAQEAPGHQNITFAEVIPDRTVESLVRALSRLHAKYRMLGIQVYRLHTDRERSFASVPIQKWCEQRQLRLTLTAGDDSKANGRIEGEVNQIKRRTRLLLHDSGLPQSLWPTALRHAAEGRVRLQLERLGLPSPPMLRYGASVLVKSKRWRRAGQLSMPYRTMQLLGPCPYMSHGWIARDKKGQLLHVRTALEPSPVADQAIMDLQEEDPLPFLDDVGGSLALQFEDERESEEVVGGPMLDSHDQSDQCQHPDLPGELEDPMFCSRQQAEQWHELEQERHWALKQLWCQGLQEVAVGEDAGSVHGSWLREVEMLLRGAEDQLSFQHSSLQNYKMASLAPMAGSTEVPVTVLQTYTVSLQQVRKELEKWKPPLRDEYDQLISSTQAIKPTSEEKLRLDPRFPTMELAPAMLVPTVKSPHGRLRARVVICGNHLTKVNEDHDNSAGEVKSKDQVLIEAGICPPTELWEISHAVYGLNDAPANWSHYRGRELPQLRFEAEGQEYQLVTTPEPNLWKLIKTCPNGIPEEDISEGFLAVYVDDMLVAAPSPLAHAVIDGIRAHWRCSEPEWASSEKSLKFCGFEIKCRPGEVILNQASYTRDLLARHEGIKSRQTPLPLGVQDELEENISIEQVRKAQLSLVNCSGSAGEPDLTSAMEFPSWAAW
ncbi:unnamed protein product [Durusdinium trenchii]|uniref:Uncharacterized protein n=1 Tax=Durusdinium trenchii TaxID=1381693 RepID=A0ABP0SSE3_9DINO